MHIEFQKVTLHNFISFGHSELVFGDDGFIKVSGVNENIDDLATSNGSGKSSLWEGIVWALTGDTIRGTKQVSNIYGDDGTYVELEFNIDSVNYILTRSKDHKVYKTGLKIVIDGKDCSGKGIRDSEKLLAQYLPDITASLLGSVIILGQGLPQKFTNNSPSGRKEVLEKLSKSDFMIEDLKERVARRKDELTKLIRSQKDAIIAAESKIGILQDQIAKCKSTLSTMDKDSLETKVAYYTVSIEKHQLFIDSNATFIEQIDQQIAELNTQLVALNSAHSANVAAVTAEDESTIEELTSRLYELRGIISSCRAEIKKLESITDICPTCGQKLPDVVKPDTSALKQQLEEAEKECVVTQTNLDNIKQARKLKLDAVETEYKQNSEGLLRQNNELSIQKSNRQAQIREKERERNQAAAELETAKAQLQKLEYTINALSLNINENQDQIDELNRELLYNNTQKDLQQSHLDVINKFDTALKRDFRGYLLATVIDYIAARAKEYSKVIFETDKIDFKLDGNNIEIAYMNKSYENLSGGEKQKIDLIIQFSIRDMLCNHLGFTSNILVLDEVFDALDMIGCQKVLDVISSLSDIKNIFIVTHRKDLSIPCDRELIVVKSSAGISELR